MGEAKREDLDDKARGLGLDPDGFRTKEDLQEAIDDNIAATSALGPREGDAPEPTGKPVVGVQPLTDKDIPDSLR